MDILCFHNPDEENGYLSNWYMSQFDVNGIGFSSMEQYMMYKKAVCFRDDVIAEKILETESLVPFKALIVCSCTEFKISSSDIILLSATVKLSLAFFTLLWICSFLYICVLIPSARVPAETFSDIFVNSRPV